MKGVSGLVIALTLGIVGAFCNWFYLAQKAKELDAEYFIGIARDVSLNPGDRFKESDLVAVPLPKLSVGNLEQSAVLWNDRTTVLGMAATRSYLPGELLLRQDLRTPPTLDVKKQLGDNEILMWIPVDTRTFVAALVDPGDWVSFVIPKSAAAVPTPLPETDVPVRGAAAAAETIGPFRIVALGNRLGTPQVLRAAGMSPSQENVMAVAVRTINGALDETGQKLSELLRVTNFQQVQVLLHKAPPAAKPK